MHLPKGSRGFTLIELLTTMAILAILAGFVSALTPIVTSTRHTEVVNTTFRIFSLARSYAVNRNTLTTICPLSASMECVDDWSRPISVFPDKDNDKRPDAGQIFQLFRTTSDQSSLFSRTAGRGYFQLAPNGMSHGSMGSLVVCTNIGNGSFKMSYIALNLGGRLRSLDDADQDGVIRLPWGATITCPTP